MRNSFASTFHEAAKLDEKLCVVVADISPAGAMNDFRDEFPDRFINTGVSEQIMIGMVAGMCMQGLKPFAYTIATFALYRPFEFIRDDLCYQNLPVTVVGIGGGVTYSTLGGTHHAQEDVAIACSLPNMSVIAPCDPLETKSATLWCTKQNIGPVYLRLGKAGEKNLAEESNPPFIFGKIRYLRKGEEVCIIGYGPILSLAIEVADNLKNKGINISVVSCHTIKPLDKDGITRILSSYKKVIILEEMISQGGLSDKVKVLAFENSLRPKIVSFGLMDKYLHVYGTHSDLLDAHGISKANILKSINC